MVSFATISIMFLFFEAERGFWFGSLIIYMLFILNFIVPKIEQYIQCRYCRASIYSLLVYLGYWAFMSFSASLLMMETPMIDWYIVLFMIVDFTIMAILI